MPGEDNLEADLKQIVEMDDDAKCCSGGTLQENLLSDGYCCAKPEAEGPEPGECAGIQPEKLPTTHLPTEVVCQPATIVVWMTTMGDNPRTGRQAIGITLGDRINPVMTPDESEYVAAVLQTAVDKVKAGYGEGKLHAKVVTDFDWPASGEQIAKSAEWVKPEDTHCEGCSVGLCKGLTT